MKLREVQDEKNVRWQCVQAFTGVAEVDKEKIAELSENGEVDVVCTPSGGSQAVRIKLEREWEVKITDLELLDAIKKTTPGASPTPIS
jgi:hypothetical protein